MRSPEMSTGNSGTRVVWDGMLFRYFSFHVLSVSSKVEHQRMTERSKEKVLIESYL